MINSLLQGMALGFGAAVPLGPINILIMNEALKKYKNGVFVGLGAMSADLTYLLLIFFGLSSFINNEIVLSCLTYFGSGFLFFMSYLIFKNRNEPIKKVEIDKKGSLLKHYVKGYFLTIFSPYTIVFWLSVTTYSTKSTNPTFTIVGMIIAIFIWVTCMPYFVYKTKHFISNEISSKIAIISSVILGVFAVVMLIKELFL